VSKDNNCLENLQIYFLFCLFGQDIRCNRGVKNNLDKMRLSFWFDVYRICADIEKFSERSLIL